MKRNSKLFVALSILMILSLCLMTACGGGSDEPGTEVGEEGGGDAEATVTTIKLGHTDSTDPTHSHYAYYVTAANKHLEELSGGTLQFEQIGSGAYGTETEVFAGLSDGSLEAGLVSVDAYSSSVPVMQLFSLPFMFQYSGQYQVLTDNEEFMQGITDLFENDYSIKVLGQPAHCGYRTLLTSKEVQSMSDLEGITLRITTSPLLQRNWELLGGIPTVVAFSETYTALQQGVVDAVEVPIEAHYFMSFYEAKEGLSIAYIPMDDLIGFPMMSMRLWDSLSEEQQGWLLEACYKAGFEQQDYLIQSEEECVEIMKEGNDVYMTYPDLAPMMEATLQVHEEYADAIGKDVLKAAYELLDADNAAEGYTLWSDLVDYTAW